MSVEVFAAIRLTEALAQRTGLLGAPKPKIGPGETLYLAQLLGFRGIPSPQALDARLQQLLQKARAWDAARAAAGAFGKNGVDKPKGTL